MLYVLTLPEQMGVLPVMAPGWGRATLPLTVTANVRGAEEPQALLAVTVIVPLLALATAAIEVVVEVPDHPPGNVHV